MSGVDQCRDAQEAGKAVQNLLVSMKTKILRGIPSVPGSFILADRLSNSVEVTELAKGTAGMTGGSSLISRSCKNICSVLLLVEETMAPIQGQQN